MTVEQQEFQELNPEVCRIWDNNADFWDSRMGEGNDFHRLLVAPAQERLLAVRPGEVVLDAACGNGQSARRLAELGARVVAFDISPRMIENARARTTRNADRIQYLVLDATDGARLLSLGEGRFDAAVCTMALMDMASIGPLVAALARLLKPDGRFVFSVCHPCFNNSSVRLVAEEGYQDGQLATEYSVRVSRYIRPAACKGVAMRGQPEVQYYFDRPLSLLFSTCFQVGFMLDGMEEPVFHLPSRADRALVWENFKDIPPVLVARMRLLRRQASHGQA